MNWLEEIEARADLVPNHTGAWADVRKLIVALKVAEETLQKFAHPHSWCEPDGENYVWNHFGNPYFEAHETIRKLQCGDFEEDVSE